MRKKFRYLVVAGVFLVSYLFAVPFDSFYSFSARSLGLGKADVALSDDWSAIVNNPAGLVQIKNIQIGATYSDFYQTEDLFNMNFSFARAFNFNAVGFFWNQLALGSVYRENTVKICFSRQLHNDFSFGLNGVLYHQSLNRTEMSGLFSESSALGFDTGFLWQISSRVTAGLMIENVTNSKIYFVRDFPPVDLPTTFRLGFDFQPLTQSHLLLELQQPVSFSCGAEIGFSDLLFFRLGWLKNYPTIGLGLKINWFQFDFGMLNNSDLGNIYRLSFTVDL